MYLEVCSFFVATYGQASTTKLRDYFIAWLFIKGMIGSPSEQSQGKESGKAEIPLRVFPWN